MSYIEEMFDLSEKVVVLTGGAGTLASSMALSLLNAGARVILWSIHKESLESVKDQLCSLSGKPSHIYCSAIDNSDEELTRKALKDAEENFKVPNALINTAGGNRGKSSFIETNTSDFEEVLKLNLIAGAVVPIKVMAAYWIEKKIKGTIINMNSMGAYIPLSGVWAYNAAKAGVHNLTIALAREFAVYGIRVNAIAPGFIIGKQNKELLVKDDQTGELTQRGKAILERTPYGRFGEACELNGAMIYLLSDKASGFVTGVCIPVDGGFLTDNI